MQGTVFSCLIELNTFANLTAWPQTNKQSLFEVTGYLIFIYLFFLCIPFLFSPVGFSSFLYKQSLIKSCLFFFNVKFLSHYPKH